MVRAAVPERSSPQGFPEHMRRIWEECPDGYTYLDSDCQEAPCYAILATRVNTDPVCCLGWGFQHCDAWHETFGEKVGVTSLNFRVPCQAGELWFNVISPIGVAGETLADDLPSDLVVDRKIPRLKEALPPERLAELCARFYAMEEG